MENKTATKTVSFAPNIREFDSSSHVSSKQNKINNNNTLHTVSQHSNNHNINISNKAHMSNKEQQAMIPTTRHNMDIINPSSLQKVGVMVQGLKDRQKELESEINATIDKETKPEREALQQAQQNYHNKLDQVLNRQDVQQKTWEREENMFQIHDTMNRVESVFAQAVFHIKRDPKLSQEQKIHQIRALEQQIDEAILTDDERKAMEIIENHIQTMVQSMVSPSAHGRQKVLMMGSNHY